MNLIIEGLCEKDFNGFSFSATKKKVYSPKRKGYKQKFVKKLKVLTVKIYFNDSDSISYYKDLNEAKITIK